MTELDDAWRTIPREPRRQRHLYTVGEPGPPVVHPPVTMPERDRGRGVPVPLDPPLWVVLVALTVTVGMPALLVCAWFNLLPGTG